MTNEELFTATFRSRGDCSEHLPVFRRLASESRAVAEMGTWTGTSATGLLMGLLESKELGKRLLIIDFNEDFLRGTAEKLSHFTKPEGEDVSIEFYKADTRVFELDTVDFLFIDTWHTYEQLKAELAIHPQNVTKYIALHDTTTFGFVGEDNKSPSLVDAVEEFLETEEGKHWVLSEQYEFNNGLMVLKRTSGGPTVRKISAGVGMSATGVSFGGGK